MSLSSVRPTLVMRHEQRSSKLPLSKYSLSILMLGVLMISASISHAEPKIHSFKLKTPTRYDQQRALESSEIRRSRFQMQVTADLNLLLLGDRDHNLQLSTLVGTGDSFTSQWSTVYDLQEGEQYPLELSMRQLYLHYVHRYAKLSLGVIPPVKGMVSNTSMDADGWIRGARVVVPVGESGVLEVVTGSIEHLQKPSAFQLPSEWNYQELEWTHQWIKSWRTEVGLMSLDYQSIVRAETRYHFSVPHLRGEVSGELLYNLTAREPAYDVSFTLAHQDYKFLFEYSDVDARFGLLGELVHDYFSLGSVVLVALQGPAWWERLTWSAKTYVSEDIFRAVLELSYSLKLTDATDQY